MKQAGNGHTPQFRHCRSCRLRAWLTVVVLGAVGGLTIALPAGPAALGPLQAAAPPKPPYLIGPAMALSDQAPPPATLATTPPAVPELVGPLVVDSQRGFLYLPGWIGRTAQVFVMAAGDARLLATYPISGSGHVALDPVHHGLYVDGSEAGLARLDPQTGALRTVAPLPAPTHMPVMAAPQLDPASGQVLVFRDNVVYRVDPEQGRVVGVLTTTIRLVPGGDVLSIVGAHYDADHGRLYLMFETSPAYHVYLGAVVAIETAGGRELGRQRIQQCTAFRMDILVVGDELYGVCRRRPTGPLDWTSFFRWEGGRPRLISEGWSNDIQPRLTWDDRRHWLYAVDDRDLLVLDPARMAPVAAVPRPEGDLMGYDPGTDQLYFLVQKDGTLHAFPVGNLPLPTPQPAHAPGSPG